MDIANELHQKFLKEIEADLARAWESLPKPILPQAQNKCLCAIRAKLHELQSRQEYYRRAYNEVVGQLTNISHGLPDWVFSCDSLQYPEEQIHEDEEVKDENEDEPIEQLGPDMLNFMLQTLRHREQRDREKALAESSATQLPPLKSNEKSSRGFPLSKRVQIESSIANFYENISECRDSPFWPAMPLRNVKQ
ncbi:hypothetical protein [Echinococcus multilocularis]|uniref:Uncharacterized protein n=1 Tax=Echinococcus multilocularis TaxID=6211 RepID=A0A068Y2I1_ECHMU|nr:hypothetical protein [Echinococcus multilocularis]